MDFAHIEYNQIYENQHSFETPTSDSSSSSHLSGMQSSEPRANYRQDGSQAAAGDRRANYSVEQSRFGFGRANTQKSKKGLLGLSNLGNTCFMNAALQCLTHTHGLQKYFRFCSHAYTSRSQSNRQKLLMSFAHWFERDWGKSVSAHYHSPEDILRAVQQLNPIFQGYAQQDSQEFLRCVLDNIHEELRREVPSDLPGHLLRCFGIEAAGEPRPGPEAREEEPPGPRPRPGPQQPPSATRQLMQLCQSTEGVTDADEIRLPAKAGPSQPGRAEAGGPTPAAPAPRAGAEDAAREAREPGRTRPSASEGSSASASSAAPPPDREKKEDEGPPATHFSSIISELFQGRVVSVVRCLECQKTSRTQEVVYDVSVPIPSANEVSNGQATLGGDMSVPGPQPQQMPGLRGPTWSGMLGAISGKVKGWLYDKGVEVTDCLRKYCAPEYLSGKDKYFCEHCKRKNDCEKRIVFKDLPEVLCIHIKRFRYDASWFNGTKNSRVVTFPVNRPLDLSSFVEDAPAQPLEYRLIGLVQHIGSMGGGHYIAYCQHKKKPQEWYEFDDVQVSMVSAEQVERAEPYVLFYQRMPSKGSKLDRQTFKTDMRRVQAQIRQYLASHPSPSSPSAVRAEAGEALQGLAAQAAEEMHHHGPALRNLYRSPPAELDIVFVTKHWYVRLTSMSQPGPLDNFEYLCPHSLLGCCSMEMAAEPFLPISRNLFHSLRQKYGGGPAISSLEICTKCQTHLRAYNERKQSEYDLVTKYDTKDTGEGKYWYLVDATWVNTWKRYVRAEPVTDIRDMCPPGPITNVRLLDKDGSTAPRSNLRLRIDYIGVNARVWWLFMHVHGGGPAICREELDIYSTEFSPETEFYIDELRGKGTSDFARSISRQFVDECHGDLGLYSTKYGGDAAYAESSPDAADKHEPPVVSNLEAKEQPVARGEDGDGCARAPLPADLDSRSSLAQADEKEPADRRAAEPRHSEAEEEQRRPESEARGHAAPEPAAPAR